MTHSDDSKSQNSSPWLTRQEVAARLKVRPSRLAYWAVVGRGPRYTKFGGRDARYRLDDVIAWEERLAFTEDAA